MLKVGLGALWIVAGVMVQVQEPAPSAIKASTGVYTEAQATRGKDIFGSICSSCHNIGSQSGAAFAKRWNGVLLSELYKVFEETMPKDDPGLLTVQERTDVIAYLLKINDFAAGSTDLSADPEALKKIVIDLVK